MAGMLDDLVAQGLVPPQILQQMETARQPQVGWARGGEQAPVPAAEPTLQQIPTMTPFPAAPTVPTLADLYPDPNMARSYMRHRRIPDEMQPWQVPLQGDDLKMYEDRRKARLAEWEKSKSAQDSEMAIRKQGEIERANKARETAAKARQDLLDRREAKKLEEAATQEKFRLEGSLQAADNAIKAARKAYADTGVLSAGLVGGVTKWIPGSPALNLDEALEPVRAITSFEQLNRMKEASRTGGALGQIAVRELDLLGASIASMNTSQSPTQLQENLRKVIQHFSSWKEKVKKAWDEEGAPSERTLYDDPDKEARYQAYKRSRQGK